MIGTYLIVACAEHRPVRAEGDSYLIHAGQLGKYL
jgi:hypothetical protein